MGYWVGVSKLQWKENISLNHVPKGHDWLAEAAHEFLDNYHNKGFRAKISGRAGALREILDSAPAKVRQLPFAEVYTEKQGHKLLDLLDESHASWKKYTKKVRGKAPHGYLVTVF